MISFCSSSFCKCAIESSSTWSLGIRRSECNPEERHCFIVQVGNTVDCEQLRDLMCKRSAAELLSNLNNMANKSVALSADEAQHWRHFLCNVAKVGEILSKHHASTLLRSTPILSRATDVHLSEETLKRLMISHGDACSVRSTLKQS